MALFNGHYVPSSGDALLFRRLAAWGNPMAWFRLRWFQQLLFREPSMHPLIHSDSYMAMHRICGWLWVFVVWSSRRSDQNRPIKDKLDIKLAPVPLGWSGHTRSCDTSFNCFARHLIMYLTVFNILYSKGDIGSCKPLKNLQSSPKKLDVSQTSRIYHNCTQRSFFSPASICVPCHSAAVQFCEFTTDKWKLVVKKGRFRDWIFFRRKVQYLTADWWGTSAPQKELTPSPGPPPDVAPGASHEWLLIHR